MAEQYRYNLNEIKQAARGRWLSILPALSGDSVLLTRASKRTGKIYQHTPCPVCGGTDRFGLLPDVEETGAAHCQHCGGFPDGFDLLRKIRGWSLPWALQQVAEFIGGGACPEPVNNQEKCGVAESQSDNRHGKAIKYLIDTSSRTPHEAARRYYHNRGIPQSADLRIESLRYHGGADVYHDGKPLVLNGMKVRYPCIIGRTSTKGRWLGLHQIFITKDGFSAAAEINAIVDTLFPESAPHKIRNKRMIGGMIGGAVRFGKAGKVLAVGEGIETMLAVSGAIGSMSVAAAGTAALLERMEIPEQVEELLIYADKDANGRGEAAANALKSRVSSRIDVRVLTPNLDISWRDKGVDWLDCLKPSCGTIASRINEGIINDTHKD